MFSYMNCYHQIINNTLTEKICYTCDSFCELGIMMFFIIFTLCCLTSCCNPSKKKYKEIVRPESPPPYS